jgi:hypothetical protein
MLSMPTTPRNGLPMHPLAAALAAVLVCGAPSVLAGQSSATAAAPWQPQVVVVNNCNDSGSGSLRDAVGHAVDGDTIDLTQLSCSVISLSTGAILIGVDDLTLHGPGADALTISSAGYPGNGVIYDLAGGTLKVQGVSVAFGSKYTSSHAARGGCIYSAGNVEITDAHVYACTARSTGSNPASGGAVYARGDVKLISSVVELCGVTTDTGDAKGGGVFAGGDFTMAYSTISNCRLATTSRGFGGGAYVGGTLVAKYSTISDNTIDDATASVGGGLHSNGDVTILLSTISGNHAAAGGGLYMGGGNYGHTAQISESTISGNSAHAGGGIKARLPLTLYNSTIAFNTIPRSYSIPIGYAFSAGLGVLYPPVRIESSIIANNIAEGQIDDPEDVGGELSVTISGSNNLIMSAAQAIPADTIDADPLLGSLRNNGGQTATHALLPGSPAIDLGNNSGGSPTDQRGAGFPRIVNGRADIGAYERDPDRIFSNGFD